jgi:hypothetical protein
MTTLALYNVKIPLASIKRIRSFSARIGVSQSLLLRRFIEQLPGKGKPRLAKVDITAPKEEPKATKKKLVKAKVRKTKTQKRVRRTNPFDRTGGHAAPYDLKTQIILNEEAFLRDSKPAIPTPPPAPAPTVLNEPSVVEMIGHGVGPEITMNVVDSAPIEYAPDVPPASEEYTEEAPGLEDDELDPIAEARAAAE